MSNEKRYWLVGGTARNDMRQPTFSSASAKQSPRYALAAPLAQLQFSTNVSKSSLRNVGRRANDLLNFTYAKRERVGEQHVTQSRAKGSRKTLSSYSKEQYILANCQFAIRCRTILKDESVDSPIDWHLVDYVRISACVDEMPHCPICLDAPPTAARITRCGHVYCYVCVLRYFAMMGDGKDEVACCPICAEPMRERDLRIAQLRLVRTYRVGDRLQFALIRRSGDEVTRREPVSAVNVNDSVAQDDKNGSELFSKVIRISTEHLEHVIAAEHELIVSERQAVADSLQQNTDMMKRSSHSQTTNAAEFEDLEHQLVFIDLALGKLTERLTEIRDEAKKEEIFIQTVGNDSVTDSTDITKKNISASVTGTTENIGMTKTGKRYVDAFDEVADQNAGLNLEQHSPEDAVESNLPGKAEVDEAAAATSAATSSVSTGASGSCVYQSADGQPIFLHSLNVRCLLAQFGDTSASNESFGDAGGILDERFPPFISGVIVQLDSFEMTADLRRRYKHLSHLPQLSHFTIAELDLASEPGLLEDRVVRQFSTQSEKRKAARERRALEDRLRAAEAEQLALEREREHHAIFDRSNFPSLRTEEEELAEVNEMELHNEASFTQIGTKLSESPTSPTLAPCGFAASNVLQCSPTVSNSNSVWFRNTETRRSEGMSAGNGERQTFSALVKSIREDESRRQHSSTNSEKKIQESSSAAVWCKLKIDRERKRFESGGANADVDAEYEMDGASSLSHFKDAFQHDVDAALRAFSTMSTATAPATAAANANVRINGLTNEIRASSMALDCHVLQKDEAEEVADKQNTKRKKKAEKKTKTLLFSTNMQRL